MSAHRSASSFPPRRPRHTNVLPGAAALLMTATAALAQASDAAYCADLADLALRYAGDPGGNGESRPDFATLEAIENCNKGNTAAGIKALQQKLRARGFALPRRTAPA